MTKIKYIIGFFILLLTFGLKAQTSEMEYNRNYIPWDFEANDEEMEKFQNINPNSEEIILFLDNKTDTLHSEYVFQSTSKSERSLYTIYVFNNSNDSIIIARQNRSYYLIQEAKDKMGEWKPIEYWRYATCGNSYLSEKLKPNGIMKTVSVAYNGNFETQIRFKLLNDDKVYYSNPIKGFVDLSMFKVPADIAKDRTNERFTTYGGQELLYKLLFLEPYGVKELEEKQEAYVQKMAELRERNKN